MAPSGSRLVGLGRGRRASPPSPGPRQAAQRFVDRHALDGCAGSCPESGSHRADPRTIGPSLGFEEPLSRDRGRPEKLSASSGKPAATAFPGRSGRTCGLRWDRQLLGIGLLIRPDPPRAGWTGVCGLIRAATRPRLGCPGRALDLVRRGTATWPLPRALPLAARAKLVPRPGAVVVSQLAGNGDPGRIRPGTPPRQAGRRLPMATVRVPPGERGRGCRDHPLADQAGGAFRRFETRRREGSIQARLARVGDAFPEC